MIAVEIQRVGQQLRVRMPNDPRFLRFASLTSAIRDGDSWLFDAAHEVQVRALVRSILAARSGSIPAADPVAAPVRTPVLASAPATAPTCLDLGSLLDSHMDLRAQLRRAAEVVIDLDPDCVDASMLEEVSAGFESIAARLRAAASAREPARQSA